MNKIVNNISTNSLEKPLVVSFSGGRTSAFMARSLQQRYKDDERQLHFIFANTGKERTETLDFIQECENRWGLNVVWIEYDLIGSKSVVKVVNYETASRNGEPFEKMISKYGVPNKSFPHCTRELKLYPIKRYLRSIGLKNGKYETAIGIRIDEEHRINWKTAKKDNLIYPLATDFRATKDFIRNWWDNQDFDLQLKDYEGNCDMCWKKSDRKLLTIITENPKLLDWWNEMEIKYGKDEFTFFRKSRSATDLIDLATQKFTKAIDQVGSKNKLFDYDLDIEYDCFCKNS